MAGVRRGDGGVVCRWPPATVGLPERGLTVQVRRLMASLNRDTLFALILPAGEEPWRSLPHFSYAVHDELDNSAAAVARVRAAQKASCGEALLLGAVACWPPQVPERCRTGLQQMWGTGARAGCRPVPVSSCLAHV